MRAAFHSGKAARLFSAIRNSSAFYFSKVEPSDWTTPQNTNLWQDGVKTLFDPCPTGWRVPLSGLGRSPWTNFSLSNGTVIDNQGFTWGPPEIVDFTTWYPGTGYRDLDGYIIAPLFSSRYWGSSWGYSKVFCFWFNLDIMGPEGPAHTVFGFPVRCVRE